jgi:hypothetical protein
MKNEALADKLNFPFAEWTTYPKGVISDDYMLWVLPDNVKTYESAVASVNNGTMEDLQNIADNYGFSYSGLTEEEFKTQLLDAIKNDLRLPLTVDVKSKDGQTVFYLDENHQANYRCIRKLPALQ